MTGRTWSGGGKRVRPRSEVSRKVDLGAMWRGLDSVGGGINREGEGGQERRGGDRKRKWGWRYGINEKGQAPGRVQLRVPSIPRRDGVVQ